MGLLGKAVKGVAKGAGKAVKGTVKGTYKATKWGAETAMDPDMPLYGEKREMYKKQKKKRDVERRLDNHFSRKYGDSSSSRGQRNIRRRSTTRRHKQIPKLSPKEKAKRKYS